jgi:hypothetical protein
MNCEAKTNEDYYGYGCESDIWIVDEDILWAEAEKLRLPIRPGPNGSWYVAYRDFEPD